MHNAFFLGCRTALLAIACGWLAYLGASASAAEEPGGDGKAADVKAIESELNEKGLKKFQKYFYFEEETALNKDFRSLDTMKRAVTVANREQDKADKLTEAKKQEVVKMLQQRRLLRSQMEQARTVEAHNRIVSAMNELGDRIVLLEKEAEGDEQTRVVRAKANEARETYAEGLLKLRKAYDALGEKYADMAANPQVKEAISKYSEAAGPVQLGPTPAYVSLGNNLRKLEETVLSESIDLRRGSGKLFYVSVVFDGKYTKELALDTGSSLISLPYELANDVGLTPNETAQDIVLTLADGRQVPAKLMKAKSVRVGKFVAEDIECAVLPKELTEAEPLLGLAFLDHFSYKIDTERAKLIMTRVETAPAKPMR